MTSDRTRENVRLSRMWAAVAILGVVAVLPGCYMSKEVKAFLQEDRRPVSGVEYRTYPPDLLRITSLHVEEINRVSQRIRPDGKINLPLLGEFFVAGKTPAEIEKMLVASAKVFYEKADATIEIVGYNSQNYYIFGQVSRPGPMAWTGRDTLLDALAKAQPNNLAWPERIKIVRGAEPQDGGRYQAANVVSRYYWAGVHAPEEGREPKEMTFNLMAMVEEGDLSNNIILMPNDVIYVQASPLAKVGLALQRLLFPINPAIQAVGVPANFEDAGRSRYDYNR